MKCFHFYLELSIEISNENMSHCSTKGKKYAMFVAARIKKKTLHYKSQFDTVMHSSRFLKLQQI